MLSALGTDVFGSPLDKLLIIAVLTSASASTQTTILPTTRTTLSMAAHGAIPKRFGERSTRSYLTPGVSTIWMGVLSIVWYVGLTLVSENILFDSIAAIGLMIAFYYGLTGLRLRRLLPARADRRACRHFLLVGVVPLIGGDRCSSCILVKSVHRPLEARELRVGRLVVRARARRS